MTIYIVKGVKESESYKSYSIISEYGVKETKEEATKELKNILKEIKEEAEENGNIILEERIDNESLYVELDNGDIYDFDIVERKITK